MKAMVWKSLVSIIVAIVILIVPSPAGLKLNAWYYFALFSAVIVGLILEPIPIAALGLIGVALAATLGVVEPKPGDAIRWALAGFSNNTVWLIFGAFMFAMGYEKTGLGRRIALTLVKLLGGKTLGLGYAVALADLVLAPVTPSNTARTGGTIFPIVLNIPGLYGSQPGETARKIGSYLMWTVFAASCITSSMFITSLAPNVLAIVLVKKAVNLDISWAQWFIGFLPVGITMLIAIPNLVYKIYPPEIKTSKEVPTWAAQELAKMGKITSKEIGMALLIILALVLWIFGSKFIDATTVALVVIGLMVVVGIVKWEDILGNKAAWNVLVWVATVVTLADGLNKVGFITWFAKVVSVFLMGMSPVVMMAILVAIFFFIHYMFANITSHTAAVLPVIIAAGAALPGMPVKTFGMLLCYCLGIMGIITPYATGPAIVCYGTGYIPRKNFWTLGAIFGVIFLAALLIIEIPYLTFINR